MEFKLKTRPKRSPAIHRKSVCIKAEKNDRMHYSDIVKWMKGHKAGIKQYRLSKDEFSSIKEVDDAVHQYQDEQTKLNLELSPTNKMTRKKRKQQFNSRNMSIFDENNFSDLTFLNRSLGDSTKFKTK